MNALPETVLLRQWYDSDLEPFVEMNADPEVMRYFPAPLTRAESVAALTRMREAITQRGWGLWAVEVDGTFAGMTGLNRAIFPAPFTPCIEIGWRFRRVFWGRGLALRAARQALAIGFQTLALAEIVSFTAAVNTRSRRLMERLGMKLDPASEFDHPLVPEGHALRRHVLYRLNQSLTHSPGSAP